MTIVAWYLSSLVYPRNGSKKAIGMRTFLKQGRESKTSWDPQGHKETRSKEIISIMISSGHCRNPTTVQFVTI